MSSVWPLPPPPPPPQERKTRREICTRTRPQTDARTHAAVLTSANPKIPPYAYLTRACVVSYGHNGGFVLRWCSDSCHRLIPPDLLMGLTTDQAVLEIKNPFVLFFALTAFLDGLCERKPSHRLDSSTCQATKALEYFPHMLCHISTITMSTSARECVAKTMVLESGHWEIC